MKRKNLILCIGLFVIFSMTGCGVSGEKQKENTTNTPVEVVTKGPENNGPGEDEVQPYELAFVGKEETEEAKDGDFVYFKSSLYYPVFEGEYADNMNRFVTSVTESFREFLPDAKENAKFDYEDFLLGEYATSIFPEEEVFSVSCLWSKEPYITLFTKGVSSTGGAHPNVYCRSYVVNMTNGCPETVEGMLEPYGITTEELAEYVLEQIQTEHGEVLYPFDNAGDLEKEVYRFLQEHQWYFNEEGMVVFANPYEIAAYAYGMIECDISYEVLEEGLKK